MDKQETLLQVRDLCQYFGTLKAVDHVSFDIKKGEVFGMVGESGCGKTTTGRSIIKLYDITSGDVIFKCVRISAGKRSYQDAIRAARKDFAASGKTAADKARLDKIVAENKQKMKEADFDKKNCDKIYAEQEEARLKAEYEPRIEAAAGAEKETLRAEYRAAVNAAKHTRLVTRIQMIFQDPIASLNPRMTVREIIAEGLIIQGEKDQKVIDEKVYEMLELVGLVREHASRYPHEFSGGQRQRIGVARAIIMNPDLIIADEPVSALDVSIQAQVINLLNDLRRRFGLTILFIAHDLSVVKYFSDRIGVMYFGQMVELATSDELFRNPLHPYTRSLLSAIPLPDPIYEKNRKRIVYNPLTEHDYSQQQPSFREVAPGHFVMCNDEEFARYQQQLRA